MHLRLDAGQRALGVALGRELDRGDDELSLDRTHDCLVGLDLYAIEVPEHAGGLSLGLGHAVVACEELGRRVAPDGYRAAALLCDMLLAAGTDLARDRCARVAAGKARVSTTAGTGDTDVVVNADDEAGVLRAVAPVSGEVWAVAPARDDRAMPSRPVVRARVRQAAYLLGLAAQAHRLAVDRAARRRQFGQAVLSRQAVGFRLAQHFAEVSAVRLLVHEAAWRDDTGAAAALAATRALAYAAELAIEVTAQAVHVHGALGLTRSAQVHRHYQAAVVEALRWGSPAELWRQAAQWDTG